MYVCMYVCVDPIQNDPSTDLSHRPPSIPTHTLVRPSATGLFGAGLLALPGAFASVGLPLALLIFALVSAICLGTMLMLLYVMDQVKE